MEVLLDLDDCGIGNVVLMAAGFLLASRRFGWLPVLYCTDPAKLCGIDTSLFRVVTTKPSHILEFDKSTVCNARTLLDAHVQKVVREIVRAPDNLEEFTQQFEGTVAGFCLRTANPQHDGDVKFMAESAVAAAKEEMRKFSKVFVCTNDPKNLNDLPPNAWHVDGSDASVRNVPDHWIQWHILSRCPIVYHGIGSTAHNAVTSTFAPTAGIYGNMSMLVGIDSESGVIRPKYTWTHKDDVDEQNK